MIGSDILDNASTNQGILVKEWQTEVFSLVVTDIICKKRYETLSHRGLELAHSIHSGSDNSDSRDSRDGSVL